MKKFNTFMKVISALAAAVGTIYIVATYGDKIVAWAKQLMGCRGAAATFHFTTSTEPEEAPAPAPEAPAAEEAEPAQEAAPTAEEPEAPAQSEPTPVANEEDFEG